VHEEEEKNENLTDGLGSSHGLHATVDVCMQRPTASASSPGSAPIRRQVQLGPCMDLLRRRLPVEPRRLLRRWIHVEPQRLLRLQLRQRRHQLCEANKIATPFEYNSGRKGYIAENEMEENGTVPSMISFGIYGMHHLDYFSEHKLESYEINSRTGD
jgi:hypothetical protein